MSEMDTLKVLLGIISTIVSIAGFAWAYKKYTKEKQLKLLDLNKETFALSKDFIRITNLLLDKVEENQAVADSEDEAIDLYATQLMIERFRKIAHFHLSEKGVEMFIVAAEMRKAREITGAYRMMLALVNEGKILLEEWPHCDDLLAKWGMMALRLSFHQDSFAELTDKHSR